MRHCRALASGYLAPATVVMNYSACVGEMLSSLALHTPKKGSVQSLLRMEFYSVSVMMHPVTSRLKLLHSQVCNSNFSLARHCKWFSIQFILTVWLSRECIRNIIWEKLNPMKQNVGKSMSFLIKKIHKLKLFYKGPTGQPFMLLSLIEYCPLNTWVKTKHVQMWSGFWSS